MRAHEVTKRKKLLRISGVLILVALAAGTFVGFGPPGLFAKSGSPEFCASCHVMEAQYENWFHTGAHKRIQCIECHLPNDNFARHITWKGIDGMKDTVAFYSGRVPETIKLSEHGAAILKENCQRCHEQTVSMINNEDRNCWQCHRRLSHKMSGTM